MLFLYYRRFILRHLEHAGVTGNYGTHSFRKGAAHEVSLHFLRDNQIKSLGRWHSECYTIYTNVTPIEVADVFAQKMNE